MGIKSNSNVPKLAVNSRVLTFHGPMLYDSKILKVYDPLSKPTQTPDSKKSNTKSTKSDADDNTNTDDNHSLDPDPELLNERQYYIHYKGWKSTWDEWVVEDRVLEWTEENIKTRKQLKEKLELARIEAAKNAAQGKKKKLEDDHDGSSSGNANGNLNGSTNGNANNGHANNNAASGNADSTNTTNTNNSSRRVSTTERRRNRDRVSVDNHGLNTNNTPSVESSTRKRSRNSMTNNPSSGGVGIGNTSGTGVGIGNGNGSLNPLSSNILLNPQNIGEENELKNETKSEFDLIIPSILKEKLVDDWEFITKNHQLVSLPRKPNVTTILSEYRDLSSKKYLKGSGQIEILQEVVSGLRLYFDKALGNALLYKFEREQYRNVVKDCIISGDNNTNNKNQPTLPAASGSEKRMSDIYGAEHLLRLFVYLPELITYTNMDSQSLAVLSSYLRDILKFLVKNKDIFFLKEYENATPAYEAIVRGS